MLVHSLLMKSRKWLAQDILDTGHTQGFVQDNTDTNLLDKSAALTTILWLANGDFVQTMPKTASNTTVRLLSFCFVFK